MIKRPRVPATITYLGMGWMCAAVDLDIELSAGVLVVLCATDEGSNCVLKFSRLGSKQKLA
jgi:hypothetical protein